MIIGIAGNINTGKDTVASMLLYIMSVGKHKAKFSEWIIKQQAYNASYQHKIIHFADILKNNISYIFSLNRDCFDNRKFKDELWYIPFTGEFIGEKETSKYHKITIDNYLEFDCVNPKHIIKLRTIIQIYAEQCKLIFGENVWIKSTIIQADFIQKLHKFCIIPDVRFNKESLAIKKINGIVIKLERENNDIESKHISENNYIEFDYLINNNGGLSELFYKVLAIYEKLK